MRCTSARVALAAILSIVAASSATAGEADALEDDPFFGPDVVIRGQSLPPPQMRVAQVTPVQAMDPYYSAAPAIMAPAPITAQPNGVVCLPAMDPYTQCAPQHTSCPWQGHTFGLFGEFLYLNPRNVSVNYGVPQDGVIIGVPTGAVGTVDPGYNFGWRAGGYFAFGPDARITATYTRFTDNDSETITALGSNIINPLSSFPLLHTGAEAQSASASMSLNYQFADIDYEVVGACCDLYWFGYLAGVRYAKLEQGFNVTYPFAPPDGNTETFTSVDFEGAGPRAGVEGERILFPSLGFRAYGRSTASFIVGRFSNTYQQNNQFGGTEVNTAVKVDRIVPIVDFEVGMAWVGPAGHVRISGGYMVAAWFNAVNTADWIASVQNASFAPGSTTITFDGFVARAEVRF